MNVKKGKDGKTTAVYPGTFDPITKGHVDLIKRTLRLFDRIIVLVADNPRKRTLFTVQERIALIRGCFKGNRRIRVQDYHGLTVDFMKQSGAAAMIRGLRAISDFEYEFQMVLTNRKLNTEVETIFLMPDEKYAYMNSSVVKEVAQFGGDLSKFVTPNVKKALKQKFREK